MSETTELKILDVVDVDDVPGGFPTLCGCMVCGGISGFFSRQTGSVNDRQMAHQIALIQHGVYLALWKGQNVANKRIIPKICTCECDHEFAHDNRPEDRLGRCENRLTCQKCGFSRIVDSSD